MRLCQATMNFKSNGTFVKENHHLIRKRTTAFTQKQSPGGIL